VPAQGRRLATLRFACLMKTDWRPLKCSDTRRQTDRVSLSVTIDSSSIRSAKNGVAIGLVGGFGVLPASYLGSAGVRMDETSALL